MGLLCPNDNKIALIMPFLKDPQVKFLYKIIGKLQQFSDPKKKKMMYIVYTKNDYIIGLRVVSSHTGFLLFESYSNLLVQIGERLLISKIIGSYENK